jgi:hypothetical protein
MAPGVRVPINEAFGAVSKKIITESRKVARGKNPKGSIEVFVLSKIHHGGAQDL